MLLRSLLALAALASFGFAQESPSDSSAPSRRYLLVPFGAYSEETGLQIGAMGMWFLPSPQPGVEGGTVTAAGVFTTRGQRIATIGPSIPLDSGRVELSCFLSYSDWPGSYWAGGNHPVGDPTTYGMTSVGLRGEADASAAYLPGLPRELRGGAKIDLESNRTDPDVADSVLPPAMRISGGRRIGFGPVLQWDTRDRKGAPTRGVFIEASRLFYDDAWGSGRDFQRTEVAGSVFFPLPLRQVLALAASWEAAEGDVPFDRLCAPDGRHRLRGLEKGRLRGRQDAVVQAELRFPTPWWVSGTVFAEAGKVAGDAEDLLREDFRTALGGGVRLPVNAERGLNFRLDVAWVDHGTGVAASFGEAF